ncbi:TPM domain-containing protein [Flavobacterium selenitireducens]|uniref:TPM domain-containing protein n=1 Tax=Flavobacterium selenitireducens TaxID=2722704 RepID=UPI00168B4FCA|nr:TPM domain-containing protein [Flavobacterium selenitireducens]MBD3583363.1 TPM domain-containing protein [Flavobacterium selenitireducens]
MTEVSDLLSPDDELEVIEAIRLAERETSGEIRVHIEKHTNADHYKRASEVFHELGMDNTELKNGVLIYLAIDDRHFVILGDKGIDAVVENDFWDCTKDVMQNHFKNRDFKTGLIEGITRAGERLRQFFPWQEGDTDELSNEISRS